MIEVRDLVKRYGRHLAVDHLSFTVPDGQIFGFLGPNGAGKSTTMNLMTGYLGPTEGEILVDGHSVTQEPEKAKQAIGYLPEQPPLYLDMTAEEYLEFAARLKSGNFDLYYGEYKMTADWDLTELLTGSCNYGRYTSADLTALLAAERTAQGSAHDTAAAKLYAAFQAQMPFAPICFERSSVLTISGVIQGLTPSLTDPFYNLTDWKIRFA